MAVLDAPDLAGVVGTGAHQGAAVGAERNVVDRPVVALERAEELAGLGIPDSICLVVAAGGERACRRARARRRRGGRGGPGTRRMSAPVRDVPDRRDAAQPGDARGRRSAARRRA